MHDKQAKWCAQADENHGKCAIPIRCKSFEHNYVKAVVAMDLNGGTFGSREDAIAITVLALTHTTNEGLLHKCWRHFDELFFRDANFVVRNVVDLHQLVSRKALNRIMTGF